MRVGKGVRKDDMKLAASLANGPAPLFDKIVSLSKQRGFVFPSSDIYGGAGSTWDFGPLGVELKNNVKRAWWKSMVQLRDDIVGLDAAILMNPKVWEASGHVENFTDPLIECADCKHRYRQDELADATCVICPNCNEPSLGSPRKFNLMFKTFVGPVEDTASVAWLRPETAQGIFVNFNNVQTAMRKKLPFGIAQIGKSFRNEITPGNFIFRSREFEQMEMQYFVRPEEATRLYEEWKEARRDWYRELAGHDELFQFREHAENERAHYAAQAFDIEFNYPFGWKELEGIHNRTDFDLRRHTQYSGKNLEYFDEVTNTQIVPYVIETAVGADRATLAFMCAAYDEEPDKDGVRVVLRLHPDLAPYKVAILPLSKKPELSEFAKTLSKKVRPHFQSTYDETQTIGKRYRRQDEIGTPLCVTVDFDSLVDNCVTIRNRDDMAQVRVNIEELVPTLREKLGA